MVSKSRYSLKERLCVNNYADIINGVSKFVEPSDPEDAFWELYELCKYAEGMNPRLTRNQVGNLGSSLTDNLTVRSLVNYFSILSHMVSHNKGLLLRMLIAVDCKCGNRLMQYHRGEIGTPEERAMATEAVAYKSTDKFSHILKTIDDGIGAVDVCEM